MKTKTKRKRIVKPVIQVEKENPTIERMSEYYADAMLKKTEEILQSDIQDKDELISVPVSPDAVSSCDGCHFYDEPNQACTDTECRDCTGVIFVKK